MTLKNWLKEKPFTLALSSGFFGFFSHLGVVKALEEEDIHPIKWTGCSAGAIIAAAKASNCSTPDLMSLLFSIRRNDFWDPRPGPGYLKGEKFETLLRNFLKPTFEETHSPVEIVTFDLLKLRTQVVKSGNLPKAVRASGAVPGMFHPVIHNKKILYDGGIFDKSAIPSSERVFSHYLYSGSNLWEQWEYKRDKKKLESEQKMLVLRNLPQVSPFKLQNGEAAFYQSYESTLAALKMPHNQRVFTP